MTTINPELNFTLDDAVKEVLGFLTGLDLTYEPELDRYRAVTRCLNRAMRSTALEHEWSYYATTSSVGPVVEGVTRVTFPNTLRIRQTGDDSVRLVDENEVVRKWAYFLPRDALHKYGDRGAGLWCAVNRLELWFSRPFYETEAGWDIQVPTMREPEMFRLPEAPEDPDTPVTPVPDETRNQPIDFCYPDLVTLRAAYYYAQTDPVMQPRVQTLEAQYKDLMYQIIERDDRSTESPFINEFILPVHNSVADIGRHQGHPHADEWWR